MLLSFYISSHLNNFICIYLQFINIRTVHFEFSYNPKLTMYECTQLIVYFVILYICIIFCYIMA